jgi:peptidoglycan biosynthesis protein MviN/MurJ (putative lipid II flippase)
VYLLFMNALKAMLDTRATFEINVIENAINIVVGAVLYKYFGITGLGAAFAIAYLVAAIVAGIAVSKRTAGIHLRELITTIGQTLIATSVMIISVLIVGRLLSQVLPNANSVDVSKATTRTGTLIVFVGVSACTGIAAYLGTARLAGITEMTPVLSRLAKLTRLTRRSR